MTASGRSGVWLVVAVVLAAPAATQAAPGDVKTTLAAPCKYPAGLATDGTSLYVVDWREAQIFRVNPRDGEVLDTRDAPTLKPHGLAWCDGLLFVSNDQTGWVYAVNLKQNEVEFAIEAPGPRPTGLACGDRALFILERKSGQIYKVVPSDGTILSIIPAPNDTCTGLGFDGRYLWVSDRVKNELYRVDPASGMVLSILAAPGPYAAGLAWLDGHLWNVDFQHRKLYQLVIHDQQKYRLSEPREARIEHALVLYNYGPGEVRDLSVRVALPQPLASQELLSDIAFSSPPARTVTDRWGQPCALFEFPHLAGGTRQTVSYHVHARVSAIRFLIDPAETGTLADIPADIRAAYTVDGARYGVNSPYIQQTVRKVAGEEQNPYWIARRLYNFVIEQLEYEMVGGWDVPEVVLKRGKGSCSEYTFAFIALCRAAGVPARYQGSVVVRGDDASVDDAFHRWAEIYLPGYGWIPVDANRGDAKAPADQARGFGELSNRFLITTHGGGDSEYLEWGYNVLTKYKLSGHCRVEEENLAFWEPLASAPDNTGLPPGASPTDCRAR